MKCTLRPDKKGLADHQNILAPPIGSEERLYCGLETDMICIQFYLPLKRCGRLIASSF